MHYLISRQVIFNFLHDKKKNESTCLGHGQKRRINMGSQEEKYYRKLKQS